MIHIPEEAKETIRAVQASLPPFTLTITDGQEASRMISAVIYYEIRNDELAEQAMVALGSTTRDLGPERGVDEWLEVARLHGITYPKWLRPALVHYFTHLAARIKAAQ